MRLEPWFLAISVTSCATARLSPREASDLTDTLTILSTHPPDDATLARITMDLCADLPSCAGTCKRLHAAATLVDPERHGPILAECFPALEADHDATGISADLWMIRYFSRYLDQVSGRLSSDQRQAVGEARDKLRLRAR